MGRRSVRSLYTSGRLLEESRNTFPRGMIARDRIRLTVKPALLFFRKYLSRFEAATFLWFQVEYLQCNCDQNLRLQKLYVII